MMLSDERTISCEAMEITCDRGVIVMQWPAPSVLVVKLAGEVDASVASELAAALDTALHERARRITVLLDLESLEYFEPTIRQTLTEVLREHRGRATPVCVLASAPWVRLGASVTALVLALDDVRVTGDRGVFERELAVAVGRLRRQTTVAELMFSL
jgi:anti-anti-sigma factor